MRLRRFSSLSLIMTVSSQSTRSGDPDARSSKSALWVEGKQSHFSLVFEESSLQCDDHVAGYGRGYLSRSRTHWGRSV